MLDQVLILTSMSNKIDVIKLISEFQSKKKISRFSLIKPMYIKINFRSEHQPQLYNKID